MTISRHQAKAVLHSTDRNPDIVCRYRCVGTPEGIENDRIFFGRLLSHVQNPYAGRGQKPSKLIFIFPPPPAFDETRDEFAQNTEFKKISSLL